MLKLLQQGSWAPTSVCDLWLLIRCDMGCERNVSEPRPQEQCCLLGCLLLSGFLSYRAAPFSLELCPLRLGAVIGRHHPSALAPASLGIPALQPCLWESSWRTLYPPPPCLWPTLGRPERLLVEGFFRTPLRACLRD